LFIGDSILVLMALVTGGFSSNWLIIFYFLIMLMTTLGKGSRAVFLNGLVFVGLYLLLLIREHGANLVHHSDVMVQVPFLVICSVFHGVWVDYEHQRRRRIVFQTDEWRRRTAGALHRSERRFSGLIDSITDVFFAMDSDFRYTYWNRASEQLVGIAAQEAVGRTLYEVFPDIRGTKAEDLYLQVLKTQQARTVLNEYELHGKEYAFELTAYPMGDGIAVLSKDMTERKRAENDLRQYNRNLQFLYDVSNTLNSMSPEDSFEEYVAAALRE